MHRAAGEKQKRMGQDLMSGGEDIREMGMGWDNIGMASSRGSTPGGVEGGKKDIYEKRCIN